MIKKAAVLVALAALAAPLLPSTSAHALPRGTRVGIYRRNANFPVDMAWVPGTNKVFYTEKNTGRIRVLLRRRLLRRACVNLRVSSAGERGALGIALHPRFARNHFLYVYYTNASPLENRVSRFKVINNRCRRKRNIITGLRTRGATNHNGGQLEFVLGKLFVSTGEAANPALAQQRNNRLGKVLRYNPDGTVPRGNPFGRRNPVWTYGHRNPFGLAHKTGTGVIYETENGPNCDDEFNVIVRRRNYGWGNGYACGTAGRGRNPKRPEVRWSNIIVPTDPTFYRGRMRRLNGDVYVGSFQDGTLRRLIVGSRGRNVLRRRVILRGPGILDVSKGPRGWLYFLTADSIRRIVPR